MVETKLIAAHIPIPLHKDFHKAAKLDHRNASDALRLIIEEYVKKILKK